MDINQIKCFITVARTLNFSEAARRNYVSQSTVSRYISELEKEFGVQLFIRSHRDVLLTSEGKTLLPYALEMVDTLNKATSIIKQMHNGGHGRITIACDETSYNFPTKCIKSFTKKYPEIRIDLKKFEIDDQSNVFNGDFDFCFMPRDMLPEISSINSVVTHSEQLFVIASKQSKIGKMKKISFTEISESNIVLLSENASPILYMEIMDLFRTFHISPNIVNDFEDIKSMFVAVASEIGVSIVPESLINFVSSNDLTKIPIVEDTAIVYAMAWNRENANPTLNLFVDMVKQFVSEDENLYDI